MQSPRAKNDKIYYEKNRVKINENNKKYREQNKDKIREYRELTKEHKSEYAKYYREENAVELAKKQKEYNKKYRDKKTEKRRLINEEYNLINAVQIQKDKECWEEHVAQKRKELSEQFQINLDNCEAVGSIGNIHWIRKDKETAIVA